MDGDVRERLTTEISLLGSMYPGQMTFDSQAREVRYASNGATLHLRLPDNYLQSALPEVHVAITGLKTDLRDEVKHLIQDTCEPGEEVLDSIISSFDELLVATSSEHEARAVDETDDIHASNEKATVLVWLHHLLNTNKRKQCISPPSSDVSGVTKPGYPGVLVFSGPAHAVRQHVSSLKQLNWQAFQIRLESDKEWCFDHGTGVVEVETMKDIVAEVGESHKEEFLEAMRMK